MPGNYISSEISGEVQDDLQRYKSKNGLSNGEVVIKLTEQLGWSDKQQEHLRGIEK